MRIALIGAFLLLAAACAGSGPGATPAAPAATPPAAAGCNDSGGGTAVAVVDFAFNPPSTTVAVGDTVTWTNEGAAPHTVTFDGGPDCGRLEPGESVSRTFDAAGELSYVCTIHPSMRATVVVQ